MKNLCLAAAIAVLFSSCATIFIPKKQKVTINTGNPEATVYVDNEEFGTGASLTGKTVKNGAKQLVIKTPGHKDQYSAILQTHRPPAYWILQIPNPMWLIFYGFWIDAWAPKNSSYDKINEIKVDKSKLVIKASTDKYIDIQAISFDIKNKNKDINVFELKHVPELNLEMDRVEMERNQDRVEADMRDAKKKKKKLIDESEQKIEYDNSKFTVGIYKTLKTTGFVDTTNRVFADNNNTLLLEGSIKQANIYRISGKNYGSYKKVRLRMLWYVKNTFGEILDSVKTSDYSGDFVFNDMFPGNNYEKMYSDAIENAYLNLHKQPELTKHLKMETDLTIRDQELVLPLPVGVLTDKTEASEACVIVKNGSSHGSGFAITNDGYIVTNFHVVSGRISGKPGTIKVLMSDGEELDAEIVRYNKYRDLALLKVEKKFEKVFKVSSTKTFKNMLTVYTIGAPKSIELGQSISTGVISNERKNNNIHLLQLGMPVNSGNSGGPLFDDTANLHGVIVSKLVGQNTEGVSFAVPGYLLEQHLKIKFK